MVKIEVRNTQLRALWISSFIILVLLSTAVRQGIIPLNTLVLVISLVIAAVGALFLYQWTAANRLVFTEQALSLRQWTKGLFYTGYWGDTVETKIPLNDIREFWLTNIGALRQQALEVNDHQLGKQLQYPTNKDPKSFQSLPAINIVYKDGRIHLINAFSFSKSRLQKISGQLKKHDILVREF